MAEEAEIEAHGGSPRPRRGLALAPAAAALAAVCLPAAWALPEGGPALLTAALCLALGAFLRQSRLLARRTRLLNAAAAREADLVQRGWTRAVELHNHRDLVETCADPLYRIDSAGRLTFANEAYRETFGHGIDGTAGAGGPARVPPETAEDAGLPADVRLMTVGGPRWFSLDERPILDSVGRALGTQVVARDVTERRAAEAEARRRRAEAEAAEAAKSRLLTAVTHEVRTPIGGVVGMMDLLLDTELRPEQQSYAGSARGSALALLSMIDDLLDHASMEAGRLSTVERAYSVEALVQEVCELLGPRADEKGLTLAPFVARKVPAEVLGDAARVRQVLLNLVGNAIKFTDHGGVLVEARAARERLRISVRDTGRGIAPEDQDRIFREFERTQEAGAINGSGLGLAISRRLVEAMGGSLDLVSRRGRGSVFTLTLPLKAGQVQPRAPGLVGRRFVVASGTAVTRQAVALTLRDEGAQVASFAKPRRVGAAVRAGAGRDGVIVDLPMLRVLEADLPGQRVIVMLSPLEREALPWIRRRPGTSYLIKPIRRASLFARVEPELAASSARGEQESTRRLNVLLAEDDEVTALIMRATLERLGHSVERVQNGHEAIARSGRAPHPDLILIDINMPGLGGSAAAAAIRNREARLGGRRVPILAMSAGLSEADLASATAAGIDLVLRKPVSGEVLAGEIARLTGLFGGRGEELQQPQRLSHILS